MYKISVQCFEKAHEGRCFEFECVTIPDKDWSLPIPHIVFEQIKKTVNDYIYFAIVCETVWRKTKRKEVYEYYDEECCKWLLDIEMDRDLLAYLESGETMVRLTA